MTPTPLLTMRDVTKRFGATLALHGVDLDLRAGEILALIGENGAGKSTLMKLLSGADRPDGGAMELDGRPYRPRGPLDARRAGVAMIYQELSVAPDLSVADNIMLGAEPHRFGIVDRSAVRRRATAALAAVGRHRLDPSTRAGDLSVGQQQLVEIARSLAVGARVLVLDEPTSSLTRADVEHLFAMLRRLKSQGVGVVYISHFLEEVRAISDRFMVLRDGASVGGGATADASDGRIISLMVGREVTDLYPRSRRTPGEVVLQTSGVAGESGPADASLELHRGEVLGIAGIVGAGRTELLRTVFGLDRTVRGHVRVSSGSARSTPRRRWRQGVGFVSEDRKSEGLALGLSVADNTTLADLRSLATLGIVRPTRQDRVVRKWIDRLSIKCRSPRTAVSDLSGGNQQKVAIARLLHRDVDVFLLDEPTRGVDIAAKTQIYRLIDGLTVGAADGRPRAILIVSSYLPELLGICDRIAVMSRGVLGPARPVEQWDEHSLIAAAIGRGDNDHG